MKKQNHSKILGVDYDPKGDIKLFKDEWRSAGSDTQKVASYYGESMQNCMKSKIDIRRQKNTGIGK